MGKLWPILVVVGANTFYNIIAKRTPAEVDPFFSLFLTYGTAALITLLIFLLSPAEKDLHLQFQRINWTSFAFGASIIGLEFGYIFIYRTGWNVNTAPLVANITLAVILLFVGYFLFGESLSVRQILGIAVCAAGLSLISA